MSQAFVRLMRRTTYEEISLDFEQPAGMLERICLVSLARIGISFDRVLFALVDFVLVVLGGNIRSKYFCWMYAEKKKEQNCMCSMRSIVQNWKMH